MSETINIRKCDGACSTRSECIGEVKRVHVWYGYKDWGEFSYCETAIKCDTQRGFTVDFVNEEYQVTK